MEVPAQPTKRQPDPGAWRTPSAGDDTDDHCACAPTAGTTGPCFAGSGDQLCRDRSALSPQPALCPPGRGSRPSQAGPRRNEVEAPVYLGSVLSESQEGLTRAILDRDVLDRLVPLYQDHVVDLVGMEHAAEGQLRCVIEHLCR